MSHTPRNRRTRKLWSITLTLAMVAAFLPLGFSAQAAGNKALQLNGTSQYATVGNEHVSSLYPVHAGDLVQVDRRRRLADTGTGGIDDVIPLIAKGTAQDEDRDGQHQLLLRDRRLERHAGSRLRGAGTTALGRPG